MAKELHQSLEELRGAADIVSALAVQMTELLKLREAVQRAEEARLATQRGKQVFSRLVAPASDIISPKHLHEASIQNGTRKTKTRPGRLFMQSQWR
jgi:hypothetical protein